MFFLFAGVLILLVVYFMSKARGVAQVLVSIALSVPAGLALQFPMTWMRCSADVPLNCLLIFVSLPLCVVVSFFILVFLPYAQFKLASGFIIAATIASVVISIPGFSIVTIPAIIIITFAGIIGAAITTRTINIPGKNPEKIKS